MADIRILGISGTVIKDGNCDTVVKEALKSAKELASPELGEVTTEFITLADKEIAMCKHCQWCIENRAPCKIKDDAQMIYEKIAKCDGLIIGAPVWNNTVSPPFPVFWSRARSIVFFSHNFRNKVVGLVTLGFLGFGFERCLDSLKDLITPYHMLTVMEAGVAASAIALGQRAEYLEHGALDDSRGMFRTRMIGPRVVEVARMIKYATENGIVIPEQFKRTFVGARFKPSEQMEFVDGVWRNKE
ncbi:flavodoxin family protein [Chloroflexota bacterium]